MSKAITKKTQKDYIINDVVWVHENDNVGIGVSAPSARLQITGSSGDVTGTALDVNRLFIVSGSTSAPRIGIGTLTPSTALYVNANTITIAQQQTPTGAAAGVSGSIAWDLDYLYVCTGSAGGWGRVALSDF